MHKVLNRNTLLSIGLSLVALAILVRMAPPYVPKVIQLQVHKNNDPIVHIDQPRDIAYSRSLWVDRLELFERNRLRHPKLGEIGYGEHFFLDLEHEFEVLQGGNYRFIIGSDDGFSASINGERLCRFARDRAYRKQSCRVHLEPGKHQFELSYFQAGSGAGLTVEYMRVGEDQSYFFGEDSELVSF